MGLFKKKNQRRWEQMAALGNTDAMTSLGALAEEAGDLDAARVWYEKATALGNTEAMAQLGGLADEAGDRAAARAWWEKAAKLGNTNAVVMLCLHANEMGDSPFEQAAKFGDPVAMAILGNLFKEAGNTTAARDWFEQAVAFGHPDAK